MGLLVGYLTFEAVGSQVRWEIPGSQNVVCRRGVNDLGSTCGSDLRVLEKLHTPNGD